MADMLKPGDTVEYVVTYLEMTERPSAPAPPRPANMHTALFLAEDPPVDYFLYLYRAVGANYEWTDWLSRPRQELEEFVGHDDVAFYTLMLNGWPGGFFVLDGSDPGTCDLAYFGLVPQAIGRGLGRWLLGTAIDMGWDLPATDRMTVNTNTLDHPRALSMYQMAGFVPTGRETHSRVLTRDRVG